MVMPRFKPTDEERKQVEAMAGFGIPFAQISAIIRNGIDEDTLNKYFKRELVQGKAKANVQIAKSLFRQATDGENVTAAIWWSKTQMGWKETQVHQITERKSAPIVMELAAPIDNEA